MLREEFIASGHKAQVTSSSHCGLACGTGDDLLVCGPMVVNCMVLNTIEYKCIWHVETQFSGPFSNPFCVLVMISIPSLDKQYWTFWGLNMTVIRSRVMEMLEILTHTAWLVASLTPRY